MQAQGFWILIQSESYFRKKLTNYQQWLLITNKIGGVCVLVRQSLTVTINETEPCKFFEYIDILLQFRSSVLRLFVIYRPPGTVSTSIFFDEFSSLLESVSCPLWML